MFELRNYIGDDSSMINELALLSFGQFKEHYDDWGAFSKALVKFSELSKDSEIIIATNSERVIIGAVTYVPPHVKKADFFPLNTPIIRMLIVDPNYRGQGVGKALILECINRACRDLCIQAQL